MSREWEPPLPAGYNDANRAFIQAFMARGTLTFPEAQKVLAGIKTALENRDPNDPVSPDTITMTDFENFIRSARDAIEPLDYDIRNMRDQTDRRGERIWAFINAHSDPATQLGTTRTPEEVAYIKRLLDAMFEEYNTPRMEVMAVDEGQALRVSRPTGRRQSNINGDEAAENSGSENGAPTSTAASRGLKHSEVLSLLSSLVAEGWLNKSEAGFYRLTERALIELWSWLMATYNDNETEADNGDGPEWQCIKFCEACKEIVTDGQRCDEPDCLVRLHDFCEDAFWRMQGSRADGERKCPKCGTGWTGNHFVGERAVTSRVGYQRSRAGRRGGRRSQAVAEPNETDEEED
ncbi:Nse1 non-SMC component of SMC5-6 complex-domain-containing protein [Chaetomium sp. MPI-SDFR-AT-0129]|nr:Nse1 non-SMC component of SMC5-6 complex-domain-containing protein [Chaetomium sp. MPI-SDFR-AT-0129]